MLVHCFVKVIVKYRIPGSLNIFRRVGKEKLGKNSQGLLPPLLYTVVDHAGTPTVW